MILKCELCFLFLFQNEYKYGYMLKLIVFGSFYHPFQDGYKNFRKTDIVSVAITLEQIEIVQFCLKICDP